MTGSKAYTLLLSDSDREALDALTSHEHLSRAALIRRLIHDARYRARMNKGDPYISGLRTKCELREDEHDRS